MPYTSQQVPPQVAPLDSVTADSLARADSLAQADSLAAADTVDALTQLNREIGEAGGLLMAGEWEAFVDKVYDGLAGLVVEMIPKLFGAIFAFLIFYVIYRVLRTLLYRLLRRSKRIDSGLDNLLMQTFRLSMLAFIGIMVLAQLGFNVAALLAGLGIAGIAIGFAARDTLENFISGITILLDRPFRIGDNIVVEGIFGTVEEITLRSTRLRTLNNEIMVMPNTHMINQRVVNHTMVSPLRVEVKFGIAYKEFPQQAREVVLGLTEGDERLDDNYTPQVVVTGLNDSSVDMALRIYLKNPKLEVPVRFEYVERIREALREADIEIPFPHLQLYIDEAKAFEDSALMQWPPADGGTRPSQAEA